MSTPFRPKRKLVIGVIHLQPLPGSPKWGGVSHVGQRHSRGKLKSVIDYALADARAYERGGVDAIIVENFGDAPFTRASVDPETIAAMSSRRLSRDRR